MQPSPTLSPTDPVPRGLLTLCPGAALAHRVSRPRGTGSVGDSVGEGGAATHTRFWRHKERTWSRRARGADEWEAGRREADATAPFCPSCHDLALLHTQKRAVFVLPCHPARHTRAPAVCATSVSSIPPFNPWRDTRGPRGAGWCRAVARARCWLCVLR